MGQALCACVLATILTLASVPAGVRADPADDVRIRAVITDQVAALSEGDARRAFAAATPEIQARFGSSTTFLAMVEANYAALVRPVEFEIEAVETAGDSAAARARVVARDGGVFDAIYPLKRQPDGDWRIDGCFLERAKGRAL